MANESDLRDVFASSHSPQGDLDPQRIISASRSRRLPRKLAAGTIGALAAVSVIVLGVQVTQFPQNAATSMFNQSSEPGQSGEASQSGDSGAPGLGSPKRVPADRINLCGAQLQQTAPSGYGLQLDVMFPESAAVGTEPIAGSVRLTNTSQQRVTGYTGPAPVITLSQAGVVLWHSNGPTLMIAVPVDLEPGASMDYPVTFTAVSCGPADDAAPGFAGNLPAVASGTYQLSAVMDFTPDAPLPDRQSPELDLVSGPTVPIRLQ